MIISLYNIIGGGGGAVIQTLRKGEGGLSQRIFFRPFGPQFGLKIGGWGAPPGPLPWVRHCRKLLQNEETLKL